MPHHQTRPGPNALVASGPGTSPWEESSYFFGFVVVDVGLVVAVVPLGHSAADDTPMMSPWARCAGTAFSDTSMKTQGLLLEPVRWQIPTFRFVDLGFVVVVVAFGFVVVVVAFGFVVVVVAFVVVVVSFLTVVVVPG
jgi:hypothetical protein